MDYEVRLTEQAETDLAALQPWLQDAVFAHLGRLAKNPHLFSRRTVSFPYGIDGMMSEFDYGPIGNESYFFTIFYRFSLDETALIVTGIGFRRFGPSLRP